MMKPTSVPLRASAVICCVVGLCLMAARLGVAKAQGLVIAAATADKDLLGTWEATDRWWRIEFAPDGVLRMKTLGAAKTGTYRLDAEGILWVRMANGRDYHAPLKLVPPDQLQLTNHDGSVTTFRRVDRHILLGTWEATDRRWRIEFAPDGVLRMKTIGAAKAGTYRLDAEGILWVRMANGRDYHAPLKLVPPDQLQLTNHDGSVTTFRRVDRHILLGTWEATDRRWRIEFAPDGVLWMKTIGPAKAGTYRLDAEGILWVRMANGRDYHAPLKLVPPDGIVKLLRWRRA